MAYIPGSCVNVTSSFGGHSSNHPTVKRKWKHSILGISVGALQISRVGRNYHLIQDNVWRLRKSSDSATNSSSSRCRANRCRCKLISEWISMTLSWWYLSDFLQLISFKIQIDKKTFWLAANFSIRVQEVVDLNIHLLPLIESCESKAINEETYQLWCW